MLFGKITAFLFSHSSGPSKIDEQSSSTADSSSDDEDSEEVEVSKTFRNPFYRGSTSVWNTSEVSVSSDTHIEVKKVKRMEKQSIRVVGDVSMLEKMKTPTQTEASEKYLRDGNDVFSNDDSDSDSQELARAREEADRQFAEMLQQMEKGQQLVRDVPKVATVRHRDFWIRFDTFLDKFSFPAHQKEAYVDLVRSFCEFEELVPEDLLLWGDLSVLPRKLCKRADVPFCGDWLQVFEELEEKERAADAYEVLLQFLSSLLPNKDAFEDEEDEKQVQMRMDTLMALLFRRRALNLKGISQFKGKGSGKNTLKKKL